MWDSKKSLWLSIILTDFFAVLIVLLCFLLPTVLNWYFGEALRAETVCTTMLAVFYPCAPFALGALIILRRLLHNIKKGEIFIRANITLLRVISWCCFAVALATLIGGIFYFPLLLPAAVFALVGLIVRVCKNVFRSAMELKDENDMTI